MRVFRIVLIILLLTAAGCTAAGTAVDTVLGRQKVDASGEVIPGSREPGIFVRGLANVVPFGNETLYGLLALANGWSMFRAEKKKKAAVLSAQEASKFEVALKSTLLAGKKLSNDPEFHKLWEKALSFYRDEHAAAGATPVIKEELAKLPTLTAPVKA